MFKRLLVDRAGAIVSAELVLLATVAAVGAGVGLTKMRDAMTVELSELSAAIDSLNQSYAYEPLAGGRAFVAGSQYVDHEPDSAKVPEPAAGESDATESPSAEQASGPADEAPADDLPPTTEDDHTRDSD